MSETSTSIEISIDNAAPDAAHVSQQQTATQQKKKTRYELLIKLINVTLSQSRSRLNVHKIVHDTYGDDASVYGGQEMLVGIVENMLDKMEETVRGKMKEYLKEQIIKERLDRIETIMDQLEKEARRIDQEEQDDFESAHKALDQALLPPGVTLEDVLIHAAYQKQLGQKEVLTRALEEVEKEIASLQQQQRKDQQSVLDNSRTLKRAAEALEKSADACSMVTAA